MTPEVDFRGLRVWWLVYRVSIVDVKVKIHTCRRRLVVPVIPVMRVMMVVMIVLCLIASG